MPADTGRPALTIVLRCGDSLARKARYVFDTLSMAAGVRTRYAAEPPAAGPWLLYSASKHGEAALQRCVAVAHRPDAWRMFSERRDATTSDNVQGLAAVLPQRANGFDDSVDIAFDLVANAFYFLSSWSERLGAARAGARQLYADSVAARLRIPQDIVDRYLTRLVDALRAACSRAGVEPWQPLEWPGSASFALVLSHDVDFLPAGAWDVALQGGKTLLRHLLRQRRPIDALRAGVGLARAIASGRDPYGCVPEIIRREAAIGVRSSFQVAVGHRHPNDVNYRIEDERVRDYLRVIGDSGFDLCLHGSYRSTEQRDWYVEEVELLTRRLGRPRGSRQHFLCFDYDNLFAAQEQAGIRYDMSMGFPDHVGPRAGFSYPYFPYCIEQDRPYDVLQIGLGLMDVTLQSYMRLSADAAASVVDGALADLARKRGCMSAVWHPIVFGGARDPGYGELYWRMVERVMRTGGLATDGRAIDAFWRERARGYASFARPTAGGHRSTAAIAEAATLD